MLESLGARVRGGLEEKSAKVSQTKENATPFPSAVKIIGFKGSQIRVSAMGAGSNLFTKTESS